MSDPIHQPHDKLFKAVFSDLEETAEFLHIYLPEPLRDLIDWQTLRLVEGTFIDEALSDQESDLLFQVLLRGTKETIFLYLLYEHQSKPLKWMRRRLYRYEDRIWDESFKINPEQELLPPILPVVFYQGESRWNYSTEFADLFPEMARNWNFVPRFAHILIDQSGLDPKQVQGGLRARILQLLMFAAYHEPILEALQLAAQLLAQLPETGGINYVRVFVRYLTATQEEKTVEAFAAAVEQHTEKKGRKIMTFAQQLFQEGKLVGEIRAQIEIVEKLLRAGISWTTIETATEIGPTRFAELQQELAQLTKPKETELIFSQSSQTE